MERVLILGCSGSGKSTLARAISARTGLPLVHLDQLWWKPGWENRTPEEFDALLAAELQGDKWIMDGNYDRTLPRRLERCDGVLYLDCARLLCLWRVLKRTVRHWGRSRADMPQGCPERVDGAFLRYIWTFQKIQRPRTLAALEGCGKPVYLLRNRRDCARFLEEHF